MPTRSRRCNSRARSCSKRSRRSTAAGRKAASRPPLRKMTRAPGPATAKDAGPFLHEQLRVARQPVHVVEQHERGDRLRLARQALRDGAGEAGHVVDQPRLEPREMPGLEIARTVVRRVTPVQVHAPEVVLAQQRHAHDVVEARSQELGKAAGTLEHHVSLRLGNADQRHHRGAPHQPQQPFAQQTAAQLGVVDRELLLERGGGEQPLDPRPEPRPMTEPSREREGHEPRAAAVVEAAPALEQADLAIPVRPRRLAERGPQRGVELARARRAAAAEELEEPLVVERADAGALELEQLVLARVHVYRQHARPAERVVERVAAGARDHEHAVGWL